MKTAVTVINTVQVGIDEYRDLKATKIFDDDTTIGEIKDWIINEFGVDNSPLSSVLDDYLWEEMQTSRCWVQVDYPEIPQELLETLKMVAGDDFGMAKPLQDMDQSPS